MRLSLRFILPLLAALTMLAYALVPLVDRLTNRWFVRDLELRARLVAASVQGPLQDLLLTRDTARLGALFGRLAEDERLFALGFCESLDGAPVATPSLPDELACRDLARFAHSDSALLRRPTGTLHVTVSSTELAGAGPGALILVHDASFIERRSAETRRYLILLFIGLAVVVSAITVLIAELSWRGWVQAIRALLRGELAPTPSSRAGDPALGPVMRDLRSLIRDLEGGRRAQDGDHLQWSAETLRSLLDRDLRGQEVMVVANRQPYLHELVNGEEIVRRPASGLVTALEPIMRVCSGTWIAHGSGSADRRVVDRNDRVRVPPTNPSYTLRRIWLTEAEELGYYYGFSNEGLWPLCHIAHMRPTFRRSDWDTYRAVNERFARAVVAESKSEDPIVLVQDYHFALLPRMVREALPNATIVTFWHIPWPNPEAFAICPWRAELLDGLLGSSILGFHTQSHCNNFVDTVDRLLEARVDREQFTVTNRGERTAVKRYPISIAWPAPDAHGDRTVDVCRAAIRSREGLPPTHALGIGVDRLDYTKGIEERFRAVERLLELHPTWINRFSFIQIAAPSRSSIEDYRTYAARVRALADRINARFGGSGPPPIVLKVEHHEQDSVIEHFRAADVCFVSSLHDGMNLVAKEFVASRDDEQGVLVLSRFTGAARELPEALIVNPYDADECAGALESALRMTPDEQRDRMRLMRALVRDFNVFRWAGRMLMDANGMRRRERIPDRSRAATQ